MRTRTVWVTLALVSCLIVAAGRLLAWNTAGTLTYPLRAASPGVSASGNNTFGLPYVREEGLNTALDLMRDINGGNMSTGPCVVLSKFNKSTDTLATCARHFGGCAIVNFPLAAGDGMFVRVVSSVPYDFGGSHDPSLVLQLDAAQPGVSATGKNFIVLPYTAVAANALQLMEDIGGGSIAPVLSVSRFNAVSDTLETYTGRMGSPAPNPFSLQPGEAYFVAMATSVPYVPSHF